MEGTGQGLRELEVHASSLALALANGRFSLAAKSSAAQLRTPGQGHLAATLQTLG